MHLQGFWHGFMADAGNAPGPQQGDVIVTLVKPVGGVDEIRVPSDLVSIAAEVGNLIGVQLVTADGRHLFIAGSNLAGIIDAPLSDQKGVRGSAALRHARDGKDEDAKDDSPAAAHDKAEAAHDKSEAAEDKATAQRRSGR